MSSDSRRGGQRQGEQRGDGGGGGGEEGEGEERKGGGGGGGGATGGASADDRQALSKCPWFWPNTSRDEANGRLAGQPDGTFLVRDCSVAGDFTLTVRKAGANRCVRIYRHGAGYTLSCSEPSEPCPSLQDLVQSYHNRPLSTSNRRLDICLTHPLPKPVSAGVNQHSLFKELYDLSQDQLTAYTRLTILQQQRAELDQRARLLQLMLPALRVVQQMYYEGVELQDQWMPRPPSQGEEDEAGDGEESSDRLRTDHCPAGQPQVDDRDDLRLSKEDEKKLTSNARLLLCRHSDMSDRLHGLKSHHDMDLTRLQDLDSDIQQQEANMLSMKRRHDRLVSQLVGQGLEQQYLSRVLEAGVGSQEMERGTWLRACSRDQAEDLLQGLPHGAFLVRPKDTKHLPYVLSVVTSGEGGGGSHSQRTVQHCHIVKPHGRGFGFNPSLAVFESIDQLVLRHRHVSLRHYFRQLDVTLAFPVGCQEMLHRSLSDSDSMPAVKEVGRRQEGRYGGYANAAAIYSMGQSVYEPVDIPEGSTGDGDGGGDDAGSVDTSAGPSPTTGGSLSSPGHGSTGWQAQARKENPYKDLDSLSNAASSSSASPAPGKKHEYEVVGESAPSTPSTVGKSDSSHTHTTHSSDIPPTHSEDKPDALKKYRYVPMGPLPAMRAESAKAPEYYEFFKENKYETISRDPQPKPGGEDDSERADEGVYEDVSAIAKPALRQTSV